MKRICVVGNGGSGKSTVSRALGEILDLPVIHLDLLFWKPGWVETPRDEFRATLEDTLAADRWVCDGNYGSTMQMRLARADTILFLDLPSWQCAWRVLRRTGKARPDLPPGCPERRLTMDYLAFLRWVFRYHKDTRSRVVAAIDEVRASKTVWHVRDQASVDRLLDSLRAARSV